MRICKACGKENPDYIRNCLDCGRNVDPNARNLPLKIGLAIFVLAGAAITFLAVKKRPFSSDENSASRKEIAAEPVVEPLREPGGIPEASKDQSIEPTIAPIPPSPPSPARSSQPETKISPASVAVTEVPKTEPAKPVPKARKRLQSQPQTIDTADILTGISAAKVRVKTPDELNMAGLKSSSEGFLRML